jgi:methyl-accepting chemotaxis protein
MTSRPQADPTSFEPQARRRRRMPIAAQVIGVVSITAVVAALAVALAATQLAGLRQGMHEMSELSAPLAALNNVQRDLQATRARIVEYPAANDERRTELRKQFAERSAKVRQGLDDYVGSEIDAKAMDDFSTAFRAIVDVGQDKIFPLADAGDDAAALKLYQDEVLPSMTVAADAVGVEYDAALAKVSSVAESGRDQASRDIATLIGVLVVGLVLAVGLGIYVSRRLAKGLRSVESSLVGMAGGDLTVAAQVRTNDEMGEMAAALATAQASLRATLSEVGETATTVAAAAEELATANTQVAASAEETSTQSAVVAEASDLVSRNVQTVASGAEQLGASISEIAQNATEAAAIAGRAMSVVAATTETVTQLGSSSQEIGVVVKTITTIAEQTNLLALNATIEAARAGDAGKGFAVVAGEVKELASETARATEEITRRVEGIQADTERAVQAIGEISAIIASINDYQTTIAAAVEEQTATTSEMSRSVTEAAESTGGIATTISGVATDVAGASQVLVQMGSAVHELARMSNDLRARVSVFSY